jgi:hypothetical protein
MGQLPLEFDVTDMRIVDILCPIDFSGHFSNNNCFTCNTILYMCVYLCMCVRACVRVHQPTIMFTLCYYVFKFNCNSCNIC